MTRNCATRRTASRWRPRRWRSTGSDAHPDGEREESVEWFRLVFFDRQAETISTYGAKGKPVFVEGRLQTRPYADRNGIIRTAIEVVISQFLLLGTADRAHEDEAAAVKTEPAETGAAIAAR